MTILKQLFDFAVIHHKKGELDTAEAKYREILRIQPGHLDATHMLGMIAYQRGQYQQAIDQIQKAIRHGLRNTHVYANLGTVFTANKQVDDAIHVLAKALEADPNNALAYNNLGNAFRVKGLDDQAIKAFKQAVSIDPTLADAFANLGAIYHKNKEMVNAELYFRKAIKLNPDHLSARHMLASLTGHVTECAPLEYVRQLFDEYSCSFDAHLVRDLGYTMPALIREEIMALVGAEIKFKNVLDLGCGTGLVGAEFRSFAMRITGVDVSERMLEKAKARSAYAVLKCCDIQEFLGSTSDIYDLCVCADVFPYIGNVYPVFRAIREHMESSSYFAFSTEYSEETGYALRNTGRYAHSRDYIKKVADETGFSIVRLISNNLRKQGDNWIPGDLVVLETNSSTVKNRL